MNAKQPQRANPQPVSRPQAAPQAAPQAKAQAKPQAAPQLLPSIATRAKAVAVAVVAVAVAATVFPATDDLTPAQDQARIDAFQAAIPLPLALVNLADPAERQAALRSLALAPAETRTLEHNLQTATERLVWITVFDDCREDGDVVEIRSLRYRREIPMVHAPTPIAVPVSAAEQAISLTGVYDGGGGITVAIRLNGQMVPVPRIRPGQTLSIPITGSGR